MVKMKPEPVRQAAPGECGLSCIAFIARCYRKKVDTDALIRRFPTSSRGASLKQLVKIANSIGFNTRALRAEPEALPQLKLPAVLHWDLNHFVVLEKVVQKKNNRYYVIVDPAFGRLKIDSRRLDRSYTGIALEVIPGQSFERTVDERVLTLSQLWRAGNGIKSDLYRVFLYALAIQATVIISPYLMRISVDSVIPTANLPLLNVLTLSFIVLAILQASIVWIRDDLLLTVSTNTSLQLAVNLAKHLIFIPVSWFERRHLGDVISRFSSIQPISDMLGRGIAALFVDVSIIITTSTVIGFSRPIFLLLSFFTCAFLSILKFFFLSHMRDLNVNSVAAQAEESTALVENIRAIETIKAFCAELSRHQVWHQKRFVFSSANHSLASLGHVQNAIQMLIISIDSIAFTFLSVKMVMSSMISIGSVMALISYRSTLLVSVSRSLDCVTNASLVKSHLRRVSSIISETSEKILRSEEDTSYKKNIKIELRRVSFRFGEGLPYIFKNLSLVIEPGDFIAITGPSGIGKSTLLKIISGLVEPTDGDILINNIPISEYGRRSYREHLGIVMQEDMLFGGTIAENICFFDPSSDADRIIDCVRLAALTKEITNMPLGTNTLVGDMGNGLSGGQKQRVFLARALYKQPRILLIDEGTAHLDLHAEAEINQSLKNLRISRIIVAHRPDTIKLADKVYILSASGLELAPRSTNDLIM